MNDFAILSIEPKKQKYLGWIWNLNSYYAIYLNNPTNQLIEFRIRQSIGYDHSSLNWTEHKRLLSQALESFAYLGDPVGTFEIESLSMSL